MHLTISNMKFRACFSLIYLASRGGFRGAFLPLLPRFSSLISLINLFSIARAAAGPSSRCASPHSADADIIVIRILRAVT